MTETPRLTDEISRYLRQLAPHMRDRQGAVLLERALSMIQEPPVSIEELEDCHYRRIAAEEERDSLREKNLANCLQITALQERVLKLEAKG